MNTPSTISLFSKTFCQVQDLQQLRHANGPDKGRRRLGLVIYILYKEESPTVSDQESTVSGILIQQTITRSTSPGFLQTAIDMKCLYLEKVDHDITLTAAQAKDQSAEVEKPPVKNS